MMSEDFGPGCVGIVWAVKDNGAIQLVTEATALPDAEVYGDFLTHPNGHHETWESWRALGPRGLVQRGLPAAIAWSEYEQFPRGRVVFHMPSRRFTVYADRHLHAASLPQKMFEAFALPADRTSLQLDAHYRSGPFV